MVLPLRRHRVSAAASPALGDLRQGTRPIVHERPPTLEQVRARIGRLDPFRDDVRQRRLDDLARVVRLLALQSRNDDVKRGPRRTELVKAFG